MTWEQLGKPKVWAVFAVSAVGGLSMLLPGCREQRPVHTAPLLPPVIPPVALPLSDVIVILDPGHGGLDPGADHGPLSEARLTYRTAVEVSASLRAQGAEVVYTVRSRALDPRLMLTEPPLARPGDAVLASTGRPLRLRHSPEPLWERAATAGAVWKKQAGRDKHARWDVFFLSLHYDQFSAESVSGSVVCVDQRVPHIPELALALAQELQQEHLGRGCEYRGVRGVSGHELGVLDPAHNPVPEKILLEVTTLSNPQDQIEAADPFWRGEIARRITEAIIRVHRNKA